MIDIIDGLNCDKIFRLEFQMSSEKNIEFKPVKRSSPDLLLNDTQKRIKYEFGEPSCSTSTFVNGENELLRKYENISTVELENLCERLMYYHATGIYVPPKQLKNCACPTKKKNNNIQSLTSETEVENKKINPKFGEGSVGVASDFLNKSACQCCSDNSMQFKNIFPLQNDPGPSTSTNSNINRLNKMADSLPSTSGLQPKIEPFLPDKPIEINSFTDFMNHSNALDLSMNNENLRNDPNASDSSNTIFYSDDESNSSINQLINNLFPQEANSPLNLSNVNSRSGTEVESLPQNISQGLTEENSVISVLDLSETLPQYQNNSVEVVDLTNSTPRAPQQPLNNEIIELLDDTFQTNLTPGVVETIDLIDSSDDDEEIKNIDKPEEKQHRNSLKTIECPICFESLKNKKIMTTICGHIFCSGCIKSAIKSKRCCPTCRKKLRKNDYHPIYLNL